MLVEGMEDRSHHVEVWTPKPVFYKLPVPMFFKKWMGYIDQFILFPLRVKGLLRKCPADTLFVFTDQALGPWVPWVARRPHVIHCHDFLAQKSARGEVVENPVGWTGKIYQRFIRWGYSKGKNFISVSLKTQADLHRFLPAEPLLSEVVYNGLNHPFMPMETSTARCSLGNMLGINLKDGYLLHVGGNDWYKNRLGVLKIYHAWTKQCRGKLPLLLIGPPPDARIKRFVEGITSSSNIHFLTGLEDEVVRLAYCGASALVFPSIDEGFGWPIAEAMASGCPVITTREAPMTEVAGSAAFFIPRCPTDSAESMLWAERAASLVQQVVGLSERSLHEVRQAGFTNAKRFNTNRSVDRIAEIYNCLLIHGSEGISS